MQIKHTDKTIKGYHTTSLNNYLDANSTAEITQESIVKVHLLVMMKLTI